MPEGYESLRNGAAWIDLSARGVIIATGRDRVRFLHNLTSNHIKQLTPGRGCYAFLLNPQGRIQADLNIFCLPDRFLLDTEPETRERAPEHMRRYIVADQVTFEEAPLAALGVEGPRAAEVLSGLQAPVPEADYAHAAWEDAVVARVSAAGLPGFRLFVPAARKAEFVARLGVPEASPEAWRTVRIEEGRPRYGEDITDANLPQETRQLHGVHFTKGCYLGQEIVERIRARGHVNRLLVKLQLAGDAPPAPGAKLTAGGEEAGHITSAAFSHARKTVIALGYARAPHAEPGSRLECEGREAVVLPS
jgi:aminomethyltransferase